MALNTPKGQQKESFFSSLSRRLNIFEFIADRLEIKEEFPTSVLKKFLFGFVLVFIYISLQHHLETLYRNLTKAEIEIKEKRASFVSHKSAVMVKSKHSQVSESLEGRGLHRNVEPPVKIVAKN
ncbi:FtsL-like putative cell division protein [Jiulongibacter sp. NS-SX5]|uniref:FtsL-like putative cell division protein n=1 Tax=Jiulongibacter sp. NS-SX5 TaxID=3463854 RepID=UPI00405A46AC